LRRGGQVVLEGGRVYYSSSIVLKSNVDLHLEQGSLLKAHSDIATYFHPNGEEAGNASVSGASAVDRPVTLKQATPSFTQRMPTIFRLPGKAQSTAMYTPL